MKELDYYMGLPYTISTYQDEDGRYVAKIVELPGCVIHGLTSDEAAERLVEVQRAWIQKALLHNTPIPEPATLS